MTEPAMPQTAVRMQRNHVRDIPDWPLPEGYTIRAIKPEDIGLWCDIWNDAEGGPKYSHDYFRKQFGSDDALIEARCMLLVDARGVVVGTTSAWFKEGIDDMGLIHWVAIRPSQQGKGLSKPLLAEAMKRLASFYPRMMLQTNAHRLPAIALYLRAGFEPMPEGNPEQAALWQLITQRLASSRPR